MIAWVVPGRLARSARPDAGGAIEAWLEQARAMGIRSILCLLDHEQLARYDGLPGGLLETYRRAGFAVGHVPVEDLRDPPIPAERLPEVWRAFHDLPAPLVVHCWAGIDRTGVAVRYLEDRLNREGGA